MKEKMPGQQSDFPHMTMKGCDILKHLLTREEDNLHSEKLDAPEFVKDDQGNDKGCSNEAFNVNLKLIEMTESDMTRKAKLNNENQLLATMKVNSSLFSNKIDSPCSCNKCCYDVNDKEMTHIKYVMVSDENQRNDAKCHHHSSHQGQIVSLQSEGIEQMVQKFDSKALLTSMIVNESGGDKVERSSAGLDHALEKWEPENGEHSEKSLEKYVEDENQTEKETPGEESSANTIECFPECMEETHSCAGPISSSDSWLGDFEPMTVDSLTEELKDDNLLKCHSNWWYSKDVEEEINNLTNTKYSQMSEMEVVHYNVYESSFSNTTEIIEPMSGLASFSRILRMQNASMDVPPSLLSLTRNLQNCSNFQKCGSKLLFSSLEFSSDTSLMSELFEGDVKVEDSSQRSHDFAIGDERGDEHLDNLLLTGGSEGSLLGRLYPCRVTMNTTKVKVRCHTGDSSNTGGSGRAPQSNSSSQVNPGNAGRQSGNGRQRVGGCSGGDDGDGWNEENRGERKRRQPASATFTPEPSNLGLPRPQPEQMIQHLRYETEMQRRHLPPEVVGPGEGEVGVAGRYDYIQDPPWPSGGVADGASSSTVAPNGDSDVLEHAAISPIDISEVVGMATSGLPQVMPGSTSQQFNLCLSHVMHNLSLARPGGDPGASSDACTLCLILGHLLTHLAGAESTCGAGSSSLASSSQCYLCAQMFHLVLWHSKLCMDHGRLKTRVTRSDLCYKVCKESNWHTDKLFSNIERLKVKIRKYCANVICPADTTSTSTPSGMGEVQEPIHASPLVSHTSSQLSLAGNPVTSPCDEDQCPDRPVVVVTSVSTAEKARHPLGPKGKSLAGGGGEGESSVKSSSEPQGNPTMTANLALPSTGPIGRMDASTGSSETQVTSQPAEPALLAGHGRLTRKPSGARAKSVAIPQPIFEERAPADPPRDDIAALIYENYGRNDDPYETQRTYGVKDRIASMPIGQIHNVEQYLSECAMPKGTPGIGEVVRGHPSQLKLVANVWESKREDCERTNHCPYHHLEEGVILAEHKEKFGLLRTRYQKHHQWERVAHLGNGMSGKCHLAIDLKTDFKFCVKKVHLLRYEAQELCLWCEIHHPNVAVLYGALRHGVKIYIFSEFIDGGSLHACIEEQRLLGRRLSHWNAINYFQQLLQVLAYLQSKNILHEDIKADNILLRQNSTGIAVIDFGTSRRLRDPKELAKKSPLGSPTHWSPEKAAMEGHGFPSDVWAAVCVLVHMLSGEPPWVRRYQERAAILNFVIYVQPAPMEDVPDNVKALVKDLIQTGFVKEPEHRPSASELLRHNAFSMLDESTPENYYSTLMSQANSLQAQRRLAEASPAPESQEAECESNRLYASAIQVSHCQESDQWPEGSQRPAEGGIAGAEGRVVDGGASNGADGATGSGAQGDTDQSGPAEGSMATNEASTTEESSHSKDIDLRAIKPVHDSNAACTKSKEEMPKASNNVNSESSSTASNPAQASQSADADKVQELMKPGDLEAFLPRFDLLHSTGDSASSVRSFLVDSYSSSTTFPQGGRAQLQVYEPETSKEDLPKLSIFMQSREDHITVLHNVGADRNPLPSSRPSQNVEPTVRSMLLPNFERFGPLTIDDMSGAANTAAGSQRAEGPVSAKISPKLNPLLSGCFMDTETSPIKFQLSVESECSSAELFASGPSTDVETIMRLRSESASSGLTPPVSPGTHSNHSNHSHSSLQQRKPTNLKLDIGLTPPSSLQRTSTPVKDAPTPATSQAERKPSQRLSSTSEPGSLLGTGAFMQTPSTGRLTSSFGRTSTASSTGSFFKLSNSVHEEQERQLLELKAEMESLSHSSSDSNKLTDVLDFPADRIDEEVEAKQEIIDPLFLLEAIQGALDPSASLGHKMEFYNTEGSLLFAAWVNEMPVHWKYFIDTVRENLERLQYNHYVLLNMGGRLMDFDHPCSQREIRVQALPLPCMKQCWCRLCHIV